MADVSVTERRIRPIQDAISARNWRQALKECEKWQKKGEKSDRFLAIKAYVLVNQADEAQVNKGQIETVGLCHRTPAVTDLDAIHILRDSLEELSLENEGDELYERAATANPSDRALLMTWLNSCIGSAGWRSAQKATMALRKAFPNERNYEFWNILLCFLIHEDHSLPDKERALFATLAYRMISKAAATIPTDQAQILSPGKAVTTPEEIALLAQIYIKTGHAADAVELLSGPTLGQDSQVGGQDPQLVLSLLLSAANAAKQWNVAIDVCEKLLQKPENHGDDRIWNTLLEAHANGDIPAKDKATKLIDKHASNEGTGNRSCMLANLRRLKQAESQDQTHLLNLCQTYYLAYRGSSFQFADLRPFLESLNAKDLRAFLDSAEASDPSASSPSSDRLFILKAHRLGSGRSAEKRLEHAGTALEIYVQNSEQGTSLPEAPLLAAVSLIQLAFQTKSLAMLLRATAVLQLTYTKYEAHFPLALLLISLYRYLGLLSLAISTFASLSIKNLQFETVAHHLFTRISTLHPHMPSTSHLDSEEGSETIMEPSMAIDTALGVNDKVADGLAESIKRGLREGSYSNILDAVNTRNSIQNSLGRRVFLIEERRMARMTGADATDENAMFGLPRVVGPLVDMRDFSFLSSYSADDEAIWDQLACGPVPKEHWLATMTLNENLRACLRQTDGYADLHEWPLLQDAGQDLRAQATHKPDENKEHLTRQEHNLHELTLHIFEMMKVYKQPNTTETDPTVQSTTAITSIEKSLNDWLTACESERLTANPKIPPTDTTWSRLHTYYTAFDAASLVLTFVGWAQGTEKESGGISTGTKKKGKNKPPPSPPSAETDPHEKKMGFQPQDSANRLRTAANDLVERVKQQARQEKQALTAGGVLSSLVDLVMGTGVERESGGDATIDDAKTTKDFETSFTAFLDAVGGEVAVEMVVGKWLVSWEDALDGVLGVDVGKVSGVNTARTGGRAGNLAGAARKGKAKKGQMK